MILKTLSWNRPTLFSRSIYWTNSSIIFPAFCEAVCFKRTAALVMGFKHWTSIVQQFSGEWNKVVRGTLHIPYITHTRLLPLIRITSSFMDQHARLVQKFFCVLLTAQNNNFINWFSNTWLCNRRPRTWSCQRWAPGPIGGHRTGPRTPCCPGWSGWIKRYFAWGHMFHDGANMLCMIYVCAYTEAIWCDTVSNTEMGWSSSRLSGFLLEMLKANLIFLCDDRGLPDDSSVPVNASQCGMMM